MKTLKIFLASPNDLNYERKISNQVIDDINKNFGRHLDITLELWGWEDTLGGVGRPQEIINKDISKCDLFIGMVWKRWGTPPAKDSEFESGFHEEFELACQLVKDNKLKNIYIYFKKVDDEQLKDPGDQLKKVLQFKEQLISDKQHFFGEFESKQDWDRTLRNTLMQYISKNLLHDFQTKKVTEKSGESVSPEIVIPASIDTPEEQIIKSAIESIGTCDDITSIKHFDQIRLHSLSSSIISDHFFQEQILHVHILNALYGYRFNYEPTNHEKSLYLKTLLDDDNNVIPGWFWINLPSRMNLNQ